MYSGYRDKERRKQYLKRYMREYRKRKKKEIELSLQDSIWLMEVLSGKREFKPTKEMIERAQFKIPKEVKTK